MTASAVDRSGLVRGQRHLDLRATGPFGHEGAPCVPTKARCEDPLNDRLPFGQCAVWVCCEATAHRTCKRWSPAPAARNTGRMACDAAFLDRKPWRATMRNPAGPWKHGSCSVVLLVDDTVEGAGGCCPSSARTRSSPGHGQTVVFLAKEAGYRLLEALRVLFLNCRNPVEASGHPSECIGHLGAHRQQQCGGVRRLGEGRGLRQIGHNGFRTGCPRDTKCHCPRWASSLRPADPPHVCVVRYLSAASASNFHGGIL